MDSMFVDEEVTVMENLGSKLGASRFKREAFVVEVQECFGDGDTAGYYSSDAARSGLSACLVDATFFDTAEEAGAAYLADPTYYTSLPLYAVRKVLVEALLLDEN